MFELGDRVVMVDNTIEDAGEIPNGTEGTIIGTRVSASVHTHYVNWDDPEIGYSANRTETEYGDFRDYRNTWWVSRETIRLADEMGTTKAPRNLTRLEKKIRYLERKQAYQSWRIKKASSSVTPPAPTAEAETTSASGRTGTRTASDVALEQALRDSMQRTLFDTALHASRETAPRTSRRSL